MSNQTPTIDNSKPSAIRQLTDTHREILRFIAESPEDPRLRDVHSHLVAIESEPYTHSPEYGSCYYNDERWDVRTHLLELQTTELIEAGGRGLGWSTTPAGTLFVEEMQPDDTFLYATLFSHEITYRVKLPRYVIPLSSSGDLERTRKGKTLFQGSGCSPKS